MKRSVILGVIYVLLYAKISFAVDYYESAGEVYIIHTTPLQAILHRVLQRNYYLFHEIPQYLNFLHAILQAKSYLLHEIPRCLKILLAIIQAKSYLLHEIPQYLISPYTLGDIL